MVEDNPTDAREHVRYYGEEDKRLIYIVTCGNDWTGFFTIEEAKDFVIERREKTGMVFLIRILEIQNKKND